MVVDYYKMLECNEKASSADIKKAYRRLALKWHPDKNPDNLEEANRRFKEISEAYEVLSDEKKRRMYDQYGPEGPNVRQNSRRHHMDPDMEFFAFHPFTFRDPEDVFKEFFGAASPLSSFFEDKNSRDKRVKSGRRGANRNNSLSAMFPGFISPFDDLLSDFHGNNFFSSSIATGGVTPVSKRTVTSTRFTNGKKITTQRVIENGKETVLQFENDVLKSKTINGVTQGLTYS